MSIYPDIRQSRRKESLFKRLCAKEYSSVNSKRARVTREGVPAGSHCLSAWNTRSFELSVMTDELLIKIPQVQ